MVVHGTEDNQVPVQSSRGLRGRFDWLDYRELADADHFDVLEPLSRAWPAVLDAVRG